MITAGGKYDTKSNMFYAGLNKSSLVLIDTQQFTHICTCHMYTYIILLTLVGWKIPKIETYISAEEGLH